MARELRDEEIVGLILSGDHESFGLLMDRYEKKLERYARSLTKDESTAADAVQSTFIKAYVNLRGFNRSRKFSSWIYRIAHNESFNLIRKDKITIPLPETWDPPSEEDVEETAVQKGVEAMVQKCLDEMPAMYAEVIFLYHMEGRSYEEISDILRLPLGTIATRIRRARALMRKLCQEK